MNISWGKCKIEYTVSSDGAPAQNAEWKKLETPKENSTQLSTNAGEKKEAKEEGGGVVDRRKAKNTYTLETDLFYKKTTTPPFEHDDGIVSGNFAFRVTPEDETCIGILIENSIVSVEDKYNTEDGILIHVVVDCLKPARGNTVKYQVIS
jgi:hypothetical protein